MKRTQNGAYKKIPGTQQRPRHINKTTNDTLQNITSVKISQNLDLSKIREWSSNRHLQSNTTDAEHTQEKNLQIIARIQDKVLSQGKK